MQCFAQTIDCQRFNGFCETSKCLAYLRPKKSWRKINEWFVRKFHSERSPICCGVSRRGVIHHVPFPYLFLWFMREMVGWGNHGCVFFCLCGTWWITPLRLAHGGWLCVLCEAERDKSCPYGWRMVAGCVFLLARNVINHAPTAGAWHLNNR